MNEEKILKIVAENFDRDFHINASITSMGLLIRELIGLQGGECDKHGVSDKMVDVSISIRMLTGALRFDSRDIEDRYAIKINRLKHILEIDDQNY